jgi:hypothetical protein
MDKAHNRMVLNVVYLRQELLDSTYIGLCSSVCFFYSGICCFSLLAGSKIKDFRDVLNSDPDIKFQLQKLRNDVHNFALKFPMPGFDDH